MKTLTFSEAKKKIPKLMSELLALEYVLTWRFSDDYAKDEKRYLKIAKMIYNP